MSLDDYQIIAVGLIYAMGPGVPAQTTLPPAQGFASLSSSSPWRVTIMYYYLIRTLSKLEAQAHK